MKTAANTDHAMSAVQNNSKTYRSVDFTTNCPKRQAGNPCSYCYVEASRNAGFNAKIIADNCHYKSAQIAKLRQPTVDKLNAMGGLRLYSFGDYMPEHDSLLTQFLNDCNDRGLDVKVITKQPDFIKKFHDYPAVKMIHISVDNVGDGVDHDEAKALKAAYGKVLIRCAVMKPADIEALGFADIFTFNHARVKGYDYKKFTATQVKEYATTGITAGKTCCETSKCSTCKVLCGRN